MFSIIIITEFLKLLCHNSLLRLVSLRDDLVFLFLQLVVVIGIIQDQRSGRKTVYYFFPIELWRFPKGFILQVTPELSLPSFHCYMCPLHF